MVLLHSSHNSSSDLETLEEVGEQVFWESESPTSGSSLLLSTALFIIRPATSSAEYLSIDAKNMRIKIICNNCVKKKIKYETIEYALGNTTVWQKGIW